MGLFHYTFSFLLVDEAFCRQFSFINELDTSSDSEPIDGSICSEPQQLQNQKIKSSSKDAEIVNLKSNEERRENAPLSSTDTAIIDGLNGSICMFLCFTLTL